ncbi:MAG TPA: VOC family protein [Ktedonobacterales bacterium]
MQTRVVLIMLYCRDLERAKAFYTGELGLEVVPQFSSDTFIFLRSDGGTPIALQDATAVPEGRAAEAGSVEIGFDVDDVEAIWRDWKAKGLDVLTEITDNGAGRLFLARDPEGHYLTISQLHDPVRAYRQTLGI